MPSDHQKKLQGMTIISGRKNSGKTAYLRSLVDRCRARGMSVAGFLSVAEIQGKTKSQYFIEDLATVRKKLLASVTPLPGFTIQYGNYRFDPQVFEWANRLLEQSRTADAVFIDEYGPVEARGSGYRAGVEFILKNSNGLVFLSVREMLREHLVKLIKECR